MKQLAAILLGAVCLAGCATLTPLTWNYTGDEAEKEYSPYLVSGSCSITGQAFLTQAGGGTVRAAGRTITLDPVTRIGDEWWGKAGIVYARRDEVPPSSNFLKARRTTIADADGRFKFSNVPKGQYFIRTEVTWIAGNYYPIQGGLVGKRIDVENGETVEVILNQYAQ